MSLIWTDPLPDDPTDDGDGLWVWCEKCAGCGEVEIEVHEGLHGEVGCPACAGRGGRYMTLEEQAERAAVEAEYRREY